MRVWVTATAPVVMQQDKIHKSRYTWRIVNLSPMTYCQALTEGGPRCCGAESLLPTPPQAPLPSPCRVIWRRDLGLVPRRDCLALLSTR